VLKDGLFMAGQFLVGFRQRGILDCLRVAVVCIPLVPKHKKVQFITANHSLCCGYGIVIPDPNFFHPGSASKNVSILSQKMVSKLSEISSGFFLPDLDPDFLPVPDPGSKGQKGTGSQIRIRNTGCGSRMFPYWFGSADPDPWNRIRVEKKKLDADSH
jgi:hypothetical protein